MITIREVGKAFGDQTLFEGANLQINNGDRFVLVGPNGAGKSTLFKMLLGEIEPDRGEIALRRGAVVGYLPQENPPAGDGTVVEEALSHHGDPDGRMTAKAKELLMGLGFTVKDFDKPVNTLSGGWAMRVAMARLLMQQPDLLLLDEPTNHLDLESLLWFQEYLTRYKGAIFVISHDRSFINAVCQSIVSVQEQSLKVYRGNYEAYVQARAAELTRLESAYRQQQEEIARMQDFIDRNRARASTANRAQSMIKRLEKLERIELPNAQKTVKFRFPQPTRTGLTTLELVSVEKAYGAVRVYRGLNFALHRGWKMAFVGHNGAGKSTLLKMLAGVEPIDAGERVLGHNVKVGYYSQHRAGALDPEKTVLEEAMDNDRLNPDPMVRSVLGSFLFPGDTVFKKVSVLSGGEKGRLSLVKLLLDPPNVLLMDEPTVHLDMTSVDALINALKAFEGTLCFISHDLYFINALADRVVHVDQGRVTVYPGNYEYFQWKREQAPHAALTFETPDPSGVPPPKRGSPGGGLGLPSVAPAPNTPIRVMEGPPKLSKNEEKRRARLLDKLAQDIDDAKLDLEVYAKMYEDPDVSGNPTKVRFVGDKLKEAQTRLEEKERALAKLVEEYPEPSGEG